MTGRKYLLYMPTCRKDLAADIFGNDRLYDIALHDFSGDKYESFKAVEYQFCGEGHKWPCIARNLPNIAKKYDYYAFFDNDISLNTKKLNTLFLMGSQLNFLLFQPSLTWNSYSIHANFLWKPYLTKKYRIHPFIEIMNPIFSAEALNDCQDTFNISESGYGLDCIWATRLDKTRMAIIDSVSVRHPRPITSHQWILSTGKTTTEELLELIKRGVVVQPNIRHSKLDRFWLAMARKFQKFIGYYPVCK